MPPGRPVQYTLTMGSTGSVDSPGGTLGGTLVADSTVTDALSTSDPTRRGGQYFRSYTFEGTAGHRAVIDMSSTDIDTYLILQGPNGFEEHNDDIVYGQDLNSRIDMILPSTGTYTVMASTYGLGETGSFNLSLSFSGDREIVTTQVEPSNTEPVVVPDTGELGEAILGPLQGELLPGDGTLTSGEYLDTYPIQGTAGQGITIELTSSQFDTYIIFTGPNGYQEDNDDFPGMGLNSRLEVTLPSDGQYSVGVTSYAPGETGTYDLSVVNGTSAQTSGTGQIYAILTGITYYGDGDVLPFCADDAEKLYEDLAETGLLASESVLLMDSQVTRANILAAFEQIASVITPEDQFMFFYSGHGFQLTAQHGDDEELDGMDETLYVYDGHITDNEMADWFDMIDARMSHIALDSCFSGGFARDVISEPNRIGYFSSEEDVLSTTAESFQAGGYLSHFLRTGLAGGADSEPHDNVVTVGELTQYLRREWADNVLDNRVEASDGARTYQNLVLERGGVSLSDVIVYPAP